MFARLLPAPVTVGIAITALVLAWPQLFGVARAPVVGSGCAPAWTASVENPGILSSAMITSQVVSQVVPPFRQQAVPHFFYR